VDTFSLIFFGHWKRRDRQWIKQILNVNFNGQKNLVLRVKWLIVHSPCTS
jgi:hypothetical protein